MLTIVLDTSVILQLFLTPTGFTNTLVRIAQLEGYSIRVTNTILDEVRAKLEQRAVSETAIEAFLNSYRKLARVVPEIRSYTAQEVSDDVHIAGCYVAARAHLVVTNDKQLLKRLTQAGIPAVRPSQFKQYLPKGTIG